MKELDNTMKEINCIANNQWDGYEGLFIKPLDETELKAIKGKHLFFSTERKKLIELAKDFLEKEISKFIKISTQDGNIGKDYVLCVYTRDNSLRDFLIKEFEKIKEVKYKGWKADKDTEKGKYSLQFQENVELEKQKLREDFLENLNLQQKNSANYNGTEKFLFVRAGAGCGKTRTIIARYLSLVERGVNPKSIVLVTFTNRAANEMKERIEKIGIEKPLFVGTFHGLCLKLIIRFSSDVNRRWIVLDERGQEELMKLAMKKRQEENFVQINFRPKTALKIYKGAKESLKTLDNILDEWKDKIRYIVENKSLDEVFYQNNKELIKKVREKKEYYITKSDKKMESEIQYIVSKISKDLNERKDKVQRIVLKQRLKKDIFYYNNKEFIEKVRRKIKFYSTQYKKELTNIVNKISEENFDIRLIIDCINIYENLKKEGWYLDFADMLGKMNELLQREDIKKWFKENVSEVIIDEMQDTNPLQLQFLEKIYGISNIFCVGDPAQAIFEFRGVNANEYKDYKVRFPSYKEFTLNENYRSTNQILRLSNWLLKDTEYKIELKSAKDLKGELPIVKKFKKPKSEVEWVVKHIKESIREVLSRETV